MKKRQATTKKTGQTSLKSELRGTKKANHLWSTVSILGFLVILGGVVFLALPFENNADATDITVYKSPTCGCCQKWVDHLRDAGFDVKTVNRANLESIKTSAQVNPNLRSCHTAFVEGYVVEGHVPVNDIRRLLKERPDVIGISAPGMPMGSPGMESQRKDAFDVLAFDKDGQTSIYASH